jgi:hypothetical protein
MKEESDLMRKEFNFFNLRLATYAWRFLISGKNNDLSLFTLCGRAVSIR